MCQYCGNTGLCYFIIAYGGLLIFRKFVRIWKRNIRNKKHKNSEHFQSNRRNPNIQPYFKRRHEK